MAQAQFREMQQLHADELVAKLSESHKELMKLNAQIASGTTPKSPGQVKNVKKTIARIRTLLNRKEAANKHE